jgi:hypothetical protein
VIKSTLDQQVFFDLSTDGEKKSGDPGTSSNPLASWRRPRDPGYSSPPPGKKNILKSVNCYLCQYVLVGQFAFIVDCCCKTDAYKHDVSVTVLPPLPPAEYRLYLFRKEN